MQASRGMVPLSGRIEADLYDWFVGLDYPGAATNSDRLREALRELRGQYEGTKDAAATMAWMQRLLIPLREALAQLHQQDELHSEVVVLLLEHLTAMTAVALSARPGSKQEAAQLEAQLVRKGFAMSEALLRQAVTSSAPAFNPKVVRQHCDRTVELAALIKNGD